MATKSLEWIYHHAAVQVHRGKEDFSCIAVSAAARKVNADYWGAERKQYATLFSPMEERPLETFDIPFVESDEKQRDFRVFLLLMASAEAGAHGE